MRRRMATIAFAVLAGLAAAVLAMPFWPRGTFALPEGESCALVEMHGYLRADASASPAVWADSDPPGFRIALTWPHGYSARFNPRLEVLNGRGEIVRREGDYLDMSGGYAAGDASAFACAW